MKHLQENMYPKVKVRVQGDEADQYDYEKNSLQSLKAFEWLPSHNFTSIDNSPGSVVRIPGSYYPKTPPPSYLSSKETNKKKTAVEENPKNVRATSAPRPRAVLSSPDNDGIIGSRTQAKRQLFSGLKKRDSSYNRHTQCKIFPKSAAAESVAATQGHTKVTTDTHNVRFFQSLQLLKVWQLHKDIPRNRQSPKVTIEQIQESEEGIAKRQPHHGFLVKVFDELNY